MEIPKPSKADLERVITMYTAALNETDDPILEREYARRINAARAKLLTGDFWQLRTADVD